MEILDVIFCLFFILMIICTLAVFLFGSQESVLLMWIMYALMILSYLLGK